MFAYSGLYEVQAFWGITALLVASYGYRAISAIRRNRRRFASTALRCIINTWVMISAMLRQPYNVILLPLQIVASSTIDEALWENDLFDLGVFVYCWLGNVFYFYQVDLQIYDYFLEEKKVTNSLKNYNKINIRKIKNIKFML